MEPKKDNTFCYYPFYNLALKSFSGEKINTAAPCCNAIEENHFDEIEGSTVQDIFNGSVMTKLRHDMLNGVKNPICNYCWKNEEKINFSPRYKSHIGHFDKESISIINPTLKSIDFGLTNKCNLRCRMCKPNCSNKLELDFSLLSKEEIAATKMHYNKVEGRTFKTIIKSPKHNIFWQNFLKNPEQVDVIKVTGGEPFYIEEFIELLDNFIEKDLAKNIELRVTTNGTKFQEKIMNRIQQFKNIRITLSLDGYKKTYEYVRYPMPWKKVESSIDYFFKTVNISYEVYVNYVVNVSNLFSIQELVEWSRLRNISGIYLNPVHPQGRGIDIRNIDKEILKIAFDKIKHYQTDNFVTGPFLNYLQYIINENITPNKNLLKTEILAFDKIRNQSYRDYLHDEIVRYLDE